MFYDLLSISVLICLPTYIYWYMIITGEQALRWCRRANARARHKGRGSERARKRDLNPLRLFTEHKYRSRTDTQIARSVVL